MHSTGSAVVNDTSETFQVLFHRKMMERSGEERLLMGVRMFESARSLAHASFPENISPQERLYKLFLRLYSRDFDQEAREQIKQRFSTF